MTRKDLVAFVAAVVVAFTVAGTAHSDVRRARSERRPYIVEIGDPFPIDTQTIQREAHRTQR